MKPLSCILGSAFLLLACFVSCTKEEVAISSASGRSLLLSHTWQLQEVTELVSGKPIVVYRRNSPQNADDFSRVRHTFKADGSLHFIDQFGNTGADGEFALQQGQGKIKMSLGAENIEGENVVIGTNYLAYTVKLSEVDAVHYRFSPAP